jgi:hypothetical protein
MSATALGRLKVADNAVSASYEGSLEPEREKQIAERAVAQVLSEGKRRVSPITLVSMVGSTTPPVGRCISLDLEDFQ